MLSFVIQILVYEKWLRKARKYKTMAGGAILNFSAILKFRKRYFYDIFYMN
jgi:hypothetical protein